MFKYHCLFNNMELFCLTIIIFLGKIRLFKTIIKQHSQCCICERRSCK